MPPETMPPSGEFPTPYPALNAVLEDLVRGARSALAESFVGAYLQGSFAVGDADEYSDVDFLIATARELSDAQVQALESIHQRIYDTAAAEWARHLEGSYVPLHVLRRHVPPGVRLPYLDNGSRVLERSDHDDTFVVRWVVREHGIVLSGPDPKALVDPVPAYELRHEIRRKIEGWGTAILGGPAYVKTRWGQPYVVLSFCRMLQTLETGRVESKRTGALWALRSLERQWSGLIEGAWNERPDPWVKVHQAAHEQDVVSTIAFVRYALDQSRRHGR
jgi:predicted nucleotidyltransferase